MGADSMAAVRGCWGDKNPGSWASHPGVSSAAKSQGLPLPFGGLGFGREEAELRGHSPPPSVPAGAVLVSGVYDLEPILHTYVNDALNMSR